MHIITKHYCDNCGKEIEGSRERDRLYDRFKIDKRICKMCIVSKDYEAKD